jgi:membrane fusion protein, adhesin transport system
VANVNFKKLSNELSGTQSLSNSAILFAVGLLIVTFITWASFTELDNVTRGQGKIVSSVQNQLVQAGEGGVILKRNVSENTEVKKGDILFEIDPVDSASELNRLVERHATLELKQARLRAEIDGGDFIVTSDLAASSPSVAASEQSLFVARRNELTGSLAVLDQQRNQRLQDLKGAEVQSGSTDRKLGLIEKEIAVLEPMVRQKIAPETRLLELQRELETSRGQFEAAAVAIDQAKAGIAAIDSEIANRTQAYRLQAMSELSDVVSSISELNEALPLLRERVSRTVIRAPMDGIIYRLNYRTPGGYVKTGDVVLELVPTGEGLMIAADIAPKDISNIQPGDDVRIRLSAYDSSRYGSVEGRVSRISADASSNDKNGASYYQVDIAIQSDNQGAITLNDGTEVVLKPGMTATVDVLSGKRTILAYFWQPIAKVKELALRD